ncbi:hypothetical protein [Alicyclobacillus tolerans]|uniref:Uncharacterized protein n=1 Tax=Alicyclobacillus tolerans TaxID=90970 RepID=A0A1M6LLA7_9BACL|nr:hypothetical protein [Alicyclobacillus montanus]SHJ71977.1 hypothetical protein SAMN05443507_1038 [Alicyclobacillus montanus]
MRNATFIAGGAWVDDFQQCPAAQGKCESVAMTQPFLDSGSLIVVQLKCRNLHEGWASLSNDDQRDWKNP